MTAATNARRVRAALESVALEQGRHTAYSACGIPYVVGGQVDDLDALVVRTPQEFRDQHRIDVRTRHRVVGVDLEMRRLEIRALDQIHVQARLRDLGVADRDLVSVMTELDRNSLQEFDGPAPDDPCEGTAVRGQEDADVVAARIQRARQRTRGVAESASLGEWREFGGDVADPVRHGSEGGGSDGRRGPPPEW